MSLIKELEADIIDQKSSLSVILKKAKVLSYMLKNDEFKRWVDKELGGYISGDVVPEYRKCATESLGYFSGYFGAALKNVPIPTGHLSKELTKFSKQHAFFEGVRALESLVEGESDQFKVPWPANLVAFISDKIFEGYICLSAWKITTKAQVEQVLDTIRNRLLSFILELQEKNPDISKSEDAISKVPKEQITSVFNTYIYGSNNVVATGSEVFQNVNQQVHSNDLKSLLDYMSKIGVQSAEVIELKEAITADGKRTEPNNLGTKVKDWINKMTSKVLDGSWQIAIGTASELIAKALAIYYGWQ